MIAADPGAEHIVRVTGAARDYKLALPNRETDAIQMHIATTHEPYEFEMLRAVIPWIVPGTRVLDIGANVGNHTIYFATHAECEVIAYEPNQDLCDALEASVEANGLSGRVEVRRAAVGSRSGHARFREHIPTNLGAQSLVSASDGEIDVVVIDEEIGDGPRVSVMKLDVEGMELEALHGAAAVIRRDSPTLFIECADLEHFDAVSAFLAELGYGPSATYNATPTHEFHPVRDGAERALSAHIADFIRDRYALTQRITELRAKLDSANLKYRGTDATLTDLRAKLDSANLKYRGTDATLTELRAQVAELTHARDEDVATLTRRARTAEAGFQRVRAEALRASEERDAARARVKQLQDAAVEQKATVSRLAGQLKSSRALAARRDAQLRTLRKRKAVVAANRLAAARKGLRSALQGLRAPSGPTAPGVKTTGPATSPKAAPFTPTVLLDNASEARFSTELRLASTERAQRAAASFRVSVSGRRPRIAAIADDFTANGFSAETDFINLDREQWREQIESFGPDLLFVESAWRGADGTWHNALPSIPNELREMLAWCGDHSIPTVFWNKEDPVHFETFLPLAAEFDFVMTTDLDRVPLYMRELAHDRVRFLPFASQPAHHNPLQTRPRRRAMMFAGGYYRRYPERMRDLAAAIRAATDVMPIEIFDRSYGTTLPDYTFPEDLQHLIVGTLAADELDDAYKGYDLALNLNSVKDSTTMFARRVFELAMSGTATVSNYARGLSATFGDLIPSSDDAAGLRSYIERLDADVDHRDRVRSLALRKVIREHTYAERLNLIVSTVTGEPYRPTAPRGAVILAPRTTDGWDSLCRVIGSQVHVETAPVVVTDVSSIAQAAADRGWRTVSRAEADAVSLAELAAGGPVAVLDERHGYGPAYLESLLGATAYAGDAGWLTKRDRFVREPGGDVARVHTGDLFGIFSPGSIDPTMSVLTPAGTGSLVLGQLLSGDVELEAACRVVAVDPFDFCENGMGAPEVRYSAALSTIDEGASIEDLLAFNDRYVGHDIPADRPVVVAPSDLPLSPPADSGWAIVRRGFGTRHISRFAEGQAATLWCRGRVDLAVTAPDGTLPMRLEAYGSVHTSLIVRWFDRDGKAITWVKLIPNHNHTVVAPPEAVSAQLGVRVEGSGAVTVRYLALSHREPDVILTPRTSDTLLVADAYPSYDNLYRYGFVHSRIREYRKQGFDVDVFRYQRADQHTFYEFEGQEVESGNAEALRQALASGQYKRVLVHFLSPELWSILREFSDRVWITVWVHGAEIQPWWRRTYANDRELAAAKAATVTRLNFWRDLLDDLPPRLGLVFVSDHFKREAFEDLERAVPDDQVAVIHNPVDTSLFAYREKDASARLRILSIRPYASPIYANDLAVAAVQELAAEPWFDELSFTFIGDGLLFESITAPLLSFDNVTVHRGFLTQGEIADAHAGYGVFLVPTRADTQGVSRGEAMSSGLVPVTSAAGAVPEFVSATEGYLAPPEDHRGLADAIREMYRDPGVFLAKSAASAARVRRQISSKIVIARELEFINRDQDS